MDPQPSPEELVIRAERALTVRGAIARLPDAQRDAATAFYLQDRTQAETAEVLATRTYEPAGRHVWSRDGPQRSRGRRLWRRIHARRRALSRPESPNGQSSALNSRHRWGRLHPPHHRTCGRFGAVGSSRGALVRTRSAIYQLNQLVGSGAVLRGRRPMRSCVERRHVRPPPFATRGRAGRAANRRDRIPSKDVRDVVAGWRHQGRSRHVRPVRRARRRSVRHPRRFVRGTCSQSKLCGAPPDSVLRVPAKRVSRAAAGWTATPSTRPSPTPRRDRCGGTPIGAHQGIAHPLGAVAIELESAATLNRRAA